MKSNRLDAVFFVFISIGVLLLFYLVYNVLTGIQEYKELIKLFSILTFPIPLSIFWAFVFAARKKERKEGTFQEIRKYIFIFIAIALLLPIMLYQYDQYNATKFYDLKLVSIFINTVATFAYALNYITVQNIAATSVLSGVLLGLAIYFFTI